MRIGLLLCLAALVVWPNQPALGQEGKGNTEDKNAIAKRAESFVEAFHRGDAKALADFWTEDGDYIDDTGRVLKGREAIEKAFAEFFSENKGLKLRIDSASLRFVTPNVAVEDGTTSVIPPDNAPPSQARYSIVHVKKDGQWYLDSVREAPVAAPNNAEQLKPLNWIIGEWTSEEKDGRSAQVSFNWTDDQNFIVSSFATTFKDTPLAGGAEWIGWDPIAKRIRSWTFASDGAFGEGTWTVASDKLVIKTTAVSRDGKKLTATNIVQRIDPDTVSWESTERSLDGKPLPDIKAIRMKRGEDKLTERR